ncbi:hypothetical protein SGCOL_001842 [Colletotrichum sp. CLE4]
MNYVTAVIGVFIIYAVTLWVIKRKTYNGPRFELILGEELPTVNPIEDQDSAKGIAVSPLNKL